MDVPESLTHRIDLFGESGKVYKFAQELFGESSWIQVMLGQGMTPKRYHPIVDQMSHDELASFLQNIRQGVLRHVQNWPAHTDFLRHYAATKVDKGMPASSESSAPQSNTPQAMPKIKSSMSAG
jgi:tryptophan halogenase